MPIPELPSFGDKFSRVGDIIRYPKRVLIEALQSAFAEPYLYTDGPSGERIENPFRYVKDEKGETAKDSPLEIADMWSERLNATDPRPIIVVQRDTVSFDKSAIGLRKNMSMPGNLTTEYANTSTIPINFLCFSRKDVESEELALTVALLFLFFKEYILRKTKLFTISLPSVGTTTPIKQDAEHELFVTPVSLSVMMTLNWKMTRTDPKKASDFVIVTTFGEQ
jgi:hypothetical protein